MDKQAYFKMMGLDKQAAIDPQVIKNILLGTGAGLGTYALSSFLPGARQNRLARLLASLGVGLGTGYFGTDIRNWFSNRPDKNQDTSDPTIEQAAEVPSTETTATEAATPPPTSKTPATEAATPAMSEAEVQAIIQRLTTPPAIPGLKTPAQGAAQMAEIGKNAPAVQAIIQRLTTPPAIPGLKTPAQVANQMQAAGRQAAEAPATKTTASKAAIPPAATTKDPYQAELDQRVAEDMRDVQLKLAENPIRYMNANPVKIRQALYKANIAARDAWMANRGYPHKINPISLGRKVRMQDFYPEIDKDEHEALYGPLPRGVVNFMDNKGGRDL